MSGDSLANAAGKGVTLTIRGEEYVVSPITLGDLADFESHVRSKQIKDFLASAGELSSEERKDVLTELVSRTIDQEKVSAEMTTLDGVRFLLWKALSRKRPKLTINDVSKLVDVQNLDEISAVVQALGGGVENPPEDQVENL